MSNKEAVFTKNLMHWHVTSNTRQMPWKEETDAYKVWLSEIILQQTKVEQGWNYYLRFVEAYPSVFDLAKAEIDAVLRLWQGLGYYSRARNLHYTAKDIVKNYNGEFPNNYKELLKLKGVGAYTAAAIASFVFKEKVAVVDGNVIRVLARYFEIETPFDTSIGKNEFASKAAKVLFLDEPDKYNQAIMDFGATICTPKKPLCTSCVLRDSCKAHKMGLVENLPFRSKKLKIKRRYFIAFHFENKNGCVIEKRESKDVWEGLFQIPLQEVNLFSKDLNRQINEVMLQKFSVQYEISEVSEPYKQKLSHQEINIVFVKIAGTQQDKMQHKYLYTRNLTKFAFPKIFILYLQSKSIFLD